MKYENYYDKIVEWLKENIIDNGNQFVAYLESKDCFPYNENKKSLQNKIITEWFIITNEAYNKLAQDEVITSAIFNN